MKKHILLLTISTAFCVTSLFAQDDMYKVIATETCDCIAKRNLQNPSRQELEMALGLCMLESINKNKVDIEITDERAMESYGQQVGIRMAGVCPQVFQAFMNEETVNVPEKVALLQVTGKVKAIEDGTLLTFVVREDSGKEHKLLWYGYFNGSDDYKENPKLLIGKQVTFSYKEIETFFPKAKAYINSKEIVSLDSVK
ncbi:MAG: hypothetical protein O9340_01430 [Cyclobacteriaceae bacterium]|jgi:hypothetical protein|nr:hypothetical protein [Cyclobacteriaceae bacterium]